MRNSGGASGSGNTSGSSESTSRSVSVGATPYDDLGSRVDRVQTLVENVLERMKTAGLSDRR